MPGNVILPAELYGFMDPDTSADKPQVERRQSPRRRVLKGGVVAFNDRHVTLPCAVRDISDGGARLRIEGSMNAPDTFDLIIEIDGLEAPCEVVSRRGNEICGALHRSAAHDAAAPRAGGECDHSRHAAVAAQAAKAGDRRVTFARSSQAAAALPALRCRCVSRSSSTSRAEMGWLNR